MPFDDLRCALEIVSARGGRLGRPLTLLDETTSTNDEAKRAAKRGAGHGATWVAEAQTHGRGRQGRAWLARPGESLLFSVLARVSCPAARVPPLALVCGLAVRDAVARLVVDDTVAIKWPNDVVVGLERKKIAGVLVEATMLGSRVEAVVIGVGLNVHARELPSEISATATSIALEGSASRPVVRAEILADILAALDRDLEVVAARGLGPVHARLAAVDALRGARVASDQGDVGRAEGIDRDGRLLVRRDDATLARWSAGEVHLVAQ